MSSLLGRNETLVAGVILAFCMVGALADPGFLSIPTLMDLLRAGIVLGILAVGVLVVLVSGGIDVSTTSLAIVALYVTTLFVQNVTPEMGWPLAFLLAAVVGALLGAINGLLIAGLGLPTLIVTLGTLSVFRGFLLTFVGSRLISNLPGGLRDFSRAMMIRGTNADGSFYSLPWAFAFLVGVVVLTWFLLYRTMLGRQVFAIGGSMESARRIGIPVRRVQFLVFVYVGALGGLAGIIHASLARVANPQDLLLNQQLPVLAAVVLGGARLEGGTGTLTGTLLGVSLIVLVSNSLIALGIPNTFQSIVIGFLILLGTGLPAWQARRAQRRAA
ncbi:Ribose ABC transport system, permease protein RbsC [Rubellimicrobium mesophilum DSM 19309]|uniref:Ribose ABC transport system, permease protein RbsC n=1 Tax=Rubellimicrobium mesophilum DSM 19309 TaxID=442562 RepID=A0A017HM56_9RHOB|nr:ABC transporter permease [Rubellimicrobium mesophilum]EYD75542.1 Ribose ABC transport system, permease protein RbsC [Rubellimicrobium mesophilum DSM 19309]